VDTVAKGNQFVRVSFKRFKAFESFSLGLRHFNILVGPNNAGKSTILAAFRILAAAMRKASARSGTLVTGPEGRTRVSGKPAAYCLLNEVQIGA
jgi:ABC-type uncharacterized transport system ATPase subunit